jgi:hypothetical protein
MRKLLAMINRGALVEPANQGDPPDQIDLFWDPETHAIRAFGRNDPDNPKPTKPRPPQVKPSR